MGLTWEGLGIHMGETWDLAGKDMRNTWERHGKHYYNRIIEKPGLRTRLFIL